MSIILYKINIVSPPGSPAETVVFFGLSYEVHGQIRQNSTQTYSLGLMASQENITSRDIYLIFGKIVRVH